MFKAIKLLSLFSATLAATVTQPTETDASRLIELDENTRMWVSEQEKVDLKLYGFDFIDITEYQDLPLIRTQAKYSYPKSLKNQGILKPVIQTLNVDNLKAYLEKLTSFETRYYKSATGAQSQKWLLEKITELTSQNAPKELQEHIEITEFKHSWGQNSIIVRIKGLNEKLGRVILSAHQDSIAYGGRAPGADDDGSGTVSNLEAFRGLVASGHRYQRTVEFHWYAAEEGGLLGSQAVAKDYASKNVEVYAQLQFDMTAWIKKGTKEVIGIFTDYVDSGLTAFNKLLVPEYLRIPLVETKCGYGCSDHASWNRAGYPASLCSESAMRDTNPNLHTPKDTYDAPEFSFPHMLEFSKFGAAFLVELGNSVDA